jgi:hypothetical protein
MGETSSGNRSSWTSPPCSHRSSSVAARSRPTSIIDRDFGYYNAAVTNMYVNRERRIKSDAWKQVRAACGFDFLPEPIKRESFQLFTTRTATPVPEAGCCSPNRDMAGTLSGSWFSQPDSTSIDHHVAIAGDIDGASLAIAGLKSKQYLSIGRGNPTYVDPAMVTGRHCYTDDADTTSCFFLVIIDDMTLDLYEGSGPCPAEPPGTKTTLFR